jgi:hypothetical protein
MVGLSIRKPAYFGPFETSSAKFRVGGKAETIVRRDDGTIVFR